MTHATDTPARLVAADTSSAADHQERARRCLDIATVYAEKAQECISPLASEEARQWLLATRLKLFEAACHLDEASAPREGQRSGQGLHGQDPPQAEVSRHA